MIEGYKPLVTERAPAAKDVLEYLAAKDEVNLYSILFRSLPLIEESKERWEKEPPKSVIDGMLARIPETSEIVPRAQAELRLLEEEKTGQKPSELEAYFLWKILKTEPKAFYMEGVEKRTGTDNSFAPAESIKCLRDRIRTKKFLRAVGKGIETKLTKAGDIRVCDAGSGAVPVLGIYAALTSERVKVTCVENNPHAAALARAAVRSFGLEDRVQVVEGDATAYVPDERIDMLVSETMDTGLLNEPMHDILNHLQPHTAEDAVILPSKVELLAGSVSIREFEKTSRFSNVGDHFIPVVETTWQTSGEYVPGKQISEISTAVPGSREQGERRVVLLGSRVFLGDDVLDLYESLISSPQSVQVIGSRDEIVRDEYETRPGHSLRVRYVPGAGTTEVRVDEIA